MDLIFIQLLFCFLFYQSKCDFQEIYQSDIDEEAVITTFISKTYTYCYMKCQKMTECAKVAFTEEPNGKVKCHMMKEMISEKKRSTSNTKATMKDVNTIRPQSDGTTKEKGVNECQKNNGGCDHHCVDTPGSFYCQCKPGYTLHCEGKLCIDVDECKTKNGGCHQVCQNTAGGFNCSCQSGYLLQDDKINCVDVDECKTENGGCHQVCQNTAGGFSCSCQSGYVLQDDKINCVDVDECKTKNGGCDHVCQNTNGSFNCACRNGYQLHDDRINCVDTNECTDSTHNCHTNAICKNTYGSFDCACKSGWNGDGKQCNDIDECKEKKHDCHLAASCYNTPGSFTCSCDDIGWSGDGKWCTGGLRFPAAVGGIEGGHNYHQGYVEIIHEGEWGSICDDAFSDATKDSTASYLCRSMDSKYTHGTYDQAYKQAVTSKATQQWLDNLSCMNNKCSHSEWGSHNCGRHEDVSIKCFF